MCLSGSNATYYIILQHVITYIPSDLARCCFPSHATLRADVTEVCPCRRKSLCPTSYAGHSVWSERCGWGERREQRARLRPASRIASKAHVRASPCSGSQLCKCGRLCCGSAARACRQRSRATNVHAHQVLPVGHRGEADRDGAPRRAARGRTLHHQITEGLDVRRRQVADAHPLRLRPEPREEPSPVLPQQVEEAAAAGRAEVCPESLRGAAYGQAVRDGDVHGACSRARHAAGLRARARRRLRLPTLSGPLPALDLTLKIQGPANHSEQQVKKM